MATSQPILFEDIFDVQKLNPEGKKFDRVDRIVSKGETYETELALDLACDVFSVKVGDKFTMAIAWTLDKAGKPDSDYYDPDGKVGARRHMQKRLRFELYALTTTNSAAGHYILCKLLPLKLAEVLQ